MNRIVSVNRKSVQSSQKNNTSDRQDYECLIAFSKVKDKQEIGLMSTVRAAAGST